MKTKKKLFPFGIFILLLFIELVISINASMAYLVYTGRSRTGEIETYIRNYSIPMAEAFARVAELSHRKEKNPRLETLFREKVQNDAIDEAFFVLTNGRIVIHSNPGVQKRLKNNILTDEFSYSTELILRQARKKSKDTLFSNYNIIGEEIPEFPFPMGTKRDHRNFIKKYIYSDVNSVGWLVSRAVFIKDRPVGTVNFIISKKRIYGFLIEHIKTSMNVLALAVIGSFFFSFIISLLIYIRYRRIQHYAESHEWDNGVRSVDMTNIKEIYDTDDESEIEEMTVEVIDEIGEEEETIIESPDIKEDIPVVGETGAKEPPDAVNRLDTSRTIRDAIPVKKKRY